jgi:hypothetical protein
MTAATPSQPDQPDQPSQPDPIARIAAGVQGIRDTAKWAVAALAALGVAIAAGSQLSSIGSIADPQRFGFAIGAAVIGLLAVGAGIWLTVDLLLPESVSLPELVHAKPDSYLGRFLSENPLLLAGEADDVADLAGKSKTAIDRRRDKYKTAEANPGDKEAEALADAADDDVMDLSPVVDRLLAFADFERTRERFSRWRWKVAVGVLVAGLSMVTFAWAANPPKSVSPTVSLRGTSLMGARLVGADLSGVDLSGADLSGADLRGAKLTGATLNNVTWTGAICPDGRKSKQEGGSCNP